MFEVKYLIPVSDNDGNVFTQAHHDAFEAKATELFGGVTFYPGHARGAWRHEGHTYRDETIIAGVAVKSLADWAKIIELEEFAKSHYRQLTVCLQYLGLVEIL
jgi:hypothetical protein